jgi:hypothetical protein
VSFPTFVLWGRTNAGCWETIQARTESLDRDDVQIAGSGIICAVDNGTAGIVLVYNIRGRRWSVHWETQGHFQFVTRGRASSVVLLVISGEMLEETYPRLEDILCGLYGGGNVQT